MWPKYRGSSSVKYTLRALVLAISWKVSLSPICESSMYTPAPECRAHQHSIQGHGPACIPRPVGPNVSTTPSISRHESQVEDEAMGGPAFLAFLSDDFGHLGLPDTHAPTHAVQRAQNGASGDVCRTSAHNMTSIQHKRIYSSSWPTSLRLSRIS
jgi:hypothetical protein